MNRQRIAQVVAVIAVVVSGAVTYTVVAPSKPEAVGVYVDAGVPGPNRALVCEVAFDVETDPPGKRYRTIGFGVFINDVDGGGKDVLLPPTMPRVASKKAIDLMDWDGCRSFACGANAISQAACNAWLDPKPWVAVPRAQSRFVIPDCRLADGGWDDNHSEVDCLRNDGDGGSVWFGCNVFPRSEIAGSGSMCIGAPSGTVISGERIEESL